MEIKSELVMCPKGHYYNAAVHASCPICGGSSGFGGGVGATEPFGGGAGGIGATEPFGGGAGGIGATEPFGGGMGGGMGGFSSTEAPVGMGGGMGGFSSTEAPVGMGGGMGGFSSTEAPVGMGGGMGGFSSTEAPVGMGGGMGGFSSTEAPVGMGGGMGSFSATEAPGAIRGGGGPGSFAPTEAPGGWGGGSPGPINPFSVQTTIGGDSLGPKGFKPVVGWLVCIDGPSRGTEWRIHAGYNYIGREVGDIHIQGDTQISREKHALVAYYAKTRSYFVGPAEGRNIVELNDGPVFNTMPLKNYDIITIGTTKLMFVGLCGDHFSWSEVADNA